MIRSFFRRSSPPLLEGQSGLLKMPLASVAPFLEQALLLPSCVLYSRGLRSDAEKETGEPRDASGLHGVNLSAFLRLLVFGAYLPKKA